MVFATSLLQGCKSSSKQATGRPNGICIPFVSRTGSVWFICKICQVLACPNLPLIALHKTRRWQDSHLHRAVNIRTIIDDIFLYCGPKQRPPSPSKLPMMGFLGTCMTYSKVISLATAHYPESCGPST